MTAATEVRQEIKVWAGERKLLALENGASPDRIICRTGKGRLRIMSHSLPLALTPGMGMALSADQVVTLSAETDMVIELEQKH